MNKLNIDYINNFPCLRLYTYDDLPHQVILKKIVDLRSEFPEAPVKKIIEVIKDNESLYLRDGTELDDKTLNQYRRYHEGDNWLNIYKMIDGQPYFIH